MDANQRACFAPASVAGQVFNVGAGAQTSLNQLWGEIKRLTHATVDPIEGVVIHDGAPGERPLAVGVDGFSGKTQ